MIQCLLFIQGKLEKNTVDWDTVLNNKFLPLQLEVQLAKLHHQEDQDDHRDHDHDDHDGQDGQNDHDYDQDVYHYYELPAVEQL